MDLWELWGAILLASIVIDMRPCQGAMILHGGRLAGCDGDHEIDVTGRLRSCEAAKREDFLWERDRNIGTRTSVVGVGYG